MTSLIEKSLLTGFGIFVLILFFIMISPFFERIEEYEKDEDNYDDLDVLEIFINKINIAIKNFIENPDKEVLEEIEYPKNINITFIDNYVKFDFVIDNKIQSKILSYNDRFVQKYYLNVTPNTYQLNITRKASLINVDFK
ncbi:MAG: hypothetical protein EU535_03215 [Promethearchaeota archaeon]|nr:MAG: hypothetical protein EU535_03215 [Candidatus Lokiarchaeota archaeon]